MEVEASSGALRRLDTLCREYSNQGLWQFQKALRSFVHEEYWDWFPVGEKARFWIWSLRLYKTAGIRAHQDQRRPQLEDAALLVCQVDEFTCPEHAELHGLILPRQHQFWSDHLPPNDWDCSCSVYSARNERGAGRLGGKVGRVLPVDWEDLHLVAEPFRKNRIPDTAEVLRLLVSGALDH